LTNVLIATNDDVLIMQYAGKMPATYSTIC